MIVTELVNGHVVYVQYDDEGNCKELGSAESPEPEDQDSTCVIPS